jgi:hypothetical protein
LAIPARRATSVSDSPALARSRRSEAAIRATTSAAVSVSAICVRSIGRIVRFDERLFGVHYIEHAV